MKIDLPQPQNNWQDWAKGVLQALQGFELDEETLVPSGAVVIFAGTEVPSGWLPCDGTEYSPRLYPKLNNAIAGLYGVPSFGFCVPDTTDLPSVTPPAQWVIKT